MKTLPLTVALVCLSTVAFAGNLRSEIESMNAKIANAMKRKDMDGFARLVKSGITSDFKYVEGGRTMTFDEMFEQMKSSFKMIDKVTEAKSKLLSLKQTATSATGKVRHSMKTTMKGQDKKVHTMTYIGVSTDVYRKVNGKWKMASMTWGEEKMLMDGKPMDMSQMGGGK